MVLHGLGCASCYEYPAVMAEPALCSGRRALLIDLLGAGNSDKPREFGYAAEAHAEYLCELLRGLGIETFDLFGHSPRRRRWQSV